MPDVLFETDGPLAFLTFNRPQARNAMTWAMYEALVDVCEKVDADPTIRVLILRGSGGRAFVAGTDISQFTEFRTPEDAIGYEARLDAVIDRLERVTRPSIAQVQGVASGAGFAIALACDIRICTADSSFGIPVARTLGNCLSAANYARLMDLIGPARLKHMMFTGRLIDAEEAAALGLVTSIVNTEVIDEAVRTEARILLDSAPQTIKATKEAIRRIQASRRIDPAAVEDLITMCYMSEDFREGVDAFLTKRPPRWKRR